MGRWLFAVSLLALCSLMMGGNAHAQSRQPIAQDVAAIRGCATKNQDDLDAGEQACLFKLVADPCMGDPGSKSDGQMADCNEIEGAIWDDLLNANYKTLLGELDADQTAKAKAMQRAWIAYRDTTCQFYYDKIQGSMAQMMIAACTTRETARRAMLLAFFSRL
ncbi:MAG: lysozyme inhibitor LprI family protein [Xanthobacteraceae bacterium]